MHRLISCALVLLLAPTAALADDDDTRFLLNQMDRQQQSEERAYPASAVADNPDLFTVNGTTYQVEQTLEALGPALYVAINLKQWHKVRQFVQRYRQLPGHDANLALLAEGMLARVDGDYAGAIAALETALAGKPEFVRARLELARIYFEDHQLNAARDAFERAQGSAGLPPQVLGMIDQYLAALDRRAGWQGSLSLGLGYDTNLNQGNGDVRVSQVCYLPNWCQTVTRRMPEPLESSEWVYDLTAERRFNLSGHHNLLLRGIVYGSYPDKALEGSDSTDYFDENTSVLYAGYSYKSARNELNLLPTFEHFYSDRHTRYEAGGLRLEWKHQWSPPLQLNTYLQTRRYRFQGEDAVYFENYDEHRLGLSASYLLDPLTALYGGLDYTRKDFPTDAASSDAWMLNLGVYRQLLTGVNLNATALYRKTRNDEANNLLGALREDKQQIYMLNVDLPRWAIKGFVPVLSLKHTINESSIDWAYGYKRDEVALKLRKTF
nr:surface lipoprotein assembly modifier [Maridesulfovibrio sp.]